MGEFTAEDTAALDKDTGQDDDPIAEELKSLGLDDPGDPGDDSTDDSKDTEDDWTRNVFGEDVDIPDELKGKDPKEFMRVYNTMRSTTQTLLKNFQGGGQPTPQPQPQSQPEEDDKPTFTDDDLGDMSDAEKFEQKLGQYFDKKARPLVQDNMRISAMNAMQVAERQLPYFDKFRDQIMQAASGANLQQLSNPRAWKFLHDSVVADNIDQLAADKVAEASRSRPAVEHTESGGGRDTSPAARANLSAEEKMIADGLGINRKTFLAMKIARQKQAGG